MSDLICIKITCETDTTSKVAKETFEWCRTKLPGIRFMCVEMTNELYTDEKDEYVEYCFYSKGAAMLFALRWL